MPLSSNTKNCKYSTKADELSRLSLNGETIHCDNNDNISLFVDEQAEYDRSDFLGPDYDDANEQIATVENVARKYSTFEPITIDKLIPAHVHDKLCPEWRLWIMKYERPFFVVH